MTSSSVNKHSVNRLPVIERLASGQLAALQLVALRLVGQRTAPRRAWSLVCGRLLALFVAGAVLLAPLRAQTSATTGLLLFVPAESRLNQQSVSVTITVDNSGAISTQSETLEAWIRAASGQSIQFTAQSGPLTGPSGTLPAGLLLWQGSALTATGGGKTAQCTSGAFTGGSDLLASSWTQSGILSCQVQFTLDAAQNPAPGVYTAQVTLSLYAR